MTNTRTLASLILASGAALLALSCGSASDSPDHPVAPPPAGSSTIGMSVVSGANASDTIGAVLRQPVVVELRDASGELVAGQPVLFESVPTKDSSGTPVLMAAFAAGSGQVAASVQGVTNAQGESGVAVVLGTIAGPAQIAISIPGTATRQIVTVWVAAGAPTRFAFLPADTGVVVGGAARLRAAGIDRAGNYQAADVTYSPSSHPEIATVSSSGTVTGVTLGSVTVTARLAGFSASGTVEVVPKATIAAYYGATAEGDSSGIVTVNLDGTQQHWLTRVYGGTAPVWGPAGGIVYTAAVPGGLFANARLFYLPPGGASALMNPTLPGDSVSELWPAYNTATRQVFYSGGPRSHETRLYVRAPDGTVREISPLGDTVPVFHPDPSPDGTKIAYSAWRTNGDPTPVVRVYDLAAAKNSTWSISGDGPRWSPDGSRIAYVQAISGNMELVNADGTNARTLSSGLSAGVPFSWSPDGAWILTRTPSGFALIDTATGRTLALNDFRSYSGPAWQ